MNIGLLPINTFGCGYYRILIPFRKLIEKYPTLYKTQVCFTKDLNLINKKDMKNLNTFIEDKDIIVIQRRTGEDWEKFAKYLKTRGIKVIYELDDTYEGIPLENIKLNAKYMCHPATKCSIKAMLDIADIVTVSTPELAEWCGKYCNYTKIHILKNTLDFSMWPIPQFKHTDTPDIQVVGFAGSESHKTDLRALEGALPLLSRKYNTKKTTKVLFGFFGYMLQEFWNLEPHVAYSKGVTFLNYPKKLSSLHYTIGIAPLKQCFFNECKSELRYLEYAALGITCVATNIAPFSRVIKKDVNGVLVKNKSRHWVSAISELLEDKLYCRYLGYNGHQDVYNNFNIDTYVSEWHNVYKKL